METTTHMVWEFTRQGGWKQIPLPVPDVNDDEPLRDWLRRAGYPYQDEIGGRDDMSAMDVYCTEDQRVPYAYVVLVNEAYSHFITVFVPAPPDLFALAEAIYPLWRMRHDTDRDEWIEDLLKKWFRAFHGHDAINICYECDPDGYARLQEARREHAARHRQQSSKEHNP